MDLRFDTRVRVSGYGYADDDPHPDAGEGEWDATYLELRVQPELRLGIGANHNISAKAEAWSGSSIVRDESEARLLDLYYDWQRKDNGTGLTLGLRAGLQEFSWGSGVLFNPTDNLSVWDASDPFDAQRLGIPAAKVSFLSGLTTMEVIYIPTFRATELSPLGDRFFLYTPSFVANPYYPKQGPPALAVRYTGIADGPEPKDDYGENQWAWRLLTTYDAWDIALSYFRGYENTALLAADLKSIDWAKGEAQLEVTRVYPEEQVYGLDISRFFGLWGVHVESAYFDMQKSGYNVGVGDEDYGVILAGVDHPLEDIIGDHDAFVTVEYAREIKANDDERIYVNRIYQDSILCRVLYTVDFKTSWEVRYIYNMDDGDSFLHVACHYQKSDVTKITAGAEIFSGPEDTFFGEYDGNDRLFVRVSIQY